MNGLKRFFVGVLVLGAVNIFAQDKTTSIVTDRPTQTTGSSVLPKSALQIETGYNYAQYNSSSDYFTIKTKSIAPTLVRYGVLDRLELRLGFNYGKEKISIFSEELKGLTPFSLSSKVYLFQEKGFIPEASILVDFGLPTGSGDFKSEAFSSQILFLANNTINETMSIGYNFGFSWPDISEEANFIYSAVFGYAVTDKLGAFGELFGNFSDVLDGHSIDFGASFLALPDLQLDAYMGVGLSQYADDFFAGFGVSYMLQL